jgi:hypothetical protein
VGGVVVGEDDQRAGGLRVADLADDVPGRARPRDQPPPDAWAVGRVVGDRGGRCCAEHRRRGTAAGEAGDPGHHPRGAEGYEPLGEPRPKGLLLDPGIAVRLPQPLREPPRGLLLTARSSPALERSERLDHFAKDGLSAPVLLGGPVRVGGERGAVGGVGHEDSFVNRCEPPPYAAGVNLKTFLPPPATETAAPPRPGRPAPKLPVEPDGRPMVIAFLRHTGCPFAEATFRRLRALAEGEPDLRIVAVSHAPSAATATWCEAVAGGPGSVELVIDEDRRLYAAWGLGRSSLAHFMGPHSLREVARLARHGIRNRHPEGTRWQTAGTFALDSEANVRWVHIPTHAGDLPDLERAARSVVAG